MRCTGDISRDSPSEDEPVDENGLSAGWGYNSDVPPVE
jgi:hypothetical protein